MAQAASTKKNYTCDLCNKGYDRALDLDSHLNSYDHQHRQRMRDMKTGLRHPPGGGKRKAEKSDMVAIDLSSVNKAKGGTKGAGKKDAAGSRPPGWPAPKTTVAIEGDLTDPEAAQARPGRPLGDTKPVDVADEEVRDEKMIDMPPLWEELDGIDELVDLGPHRPPEAQRLTDMSNAWMSARGNVEMYDDIWEQVEQIRNRAAT